MEKPKKKKEDFLLEFFFNKEGLFINGNNRGLSEFAAELLKAAQSEVGYHKHLNFSWKEMLKTGNLIINFSWINNRLTPPKKNRREFDVTIIKTKTIGNEIRRRKSK